jgi:hypothetical protein
LSHLLNGARLQPENLPCPLDLDPLDFTRFGHLRATGHQPTALSGRCWLSMRDRMLRMISLFLDAPFRLASFSTQAMSS